MSKFNTPEASKAAWEHIGDVPVDSGQLMIVDPAYVDSRWQRKPFEDIRQYRHKDTGQILQYLKDFPHYEAVIPAFGKSMNQLNATGEWEKIDQPVPPGELSYNAACRATDSLRSGGGFGGDAALHFAAAVSSGYSDGLYPVFVERDASGRIMRVMIDFTLPEEQEEA